MAAASTSLDTIPDPPYYAPKSYVRYGRGKRLVLTHTHTCGHSYTCRGESPAPGQVLEKVLRPPRSVYRDWTVCNTDYCRFVVHRPFDFDFTL